MPNEHGRLESAIAALEAQRAALGDDVVDDALAALRAKLAVVGADSSTQAEVAQSLRQVSILFLDAVGSTALSQRLDPEEIGAVMDGTLARASAIVDSFDGQVLQYAGDSMLAAFGAPGAHEDDAEHAVRCGLALLELGRTVGAEVRARHGHDGFDVRVGIHTGSVLLGGGVDAEGTIRGMAVNIAARMEQSAPPGSLRISHDTYAHVRGLFEVAVQEPLALKGLDAPLQSYLVVRAKPRSFRIVTRGIEGVATRMIGRDAELEQLQLAFERLLSAREFVAVLVIAEAGLGKSRLLYEFEAWAETRPEFFLMFRGRATPHTVAQPFGLLRDILAWRFQIADDDTVAAARAKLEQGVVPLFLVDEAQDQAEAHVHLLGHLIGIEYRDSRHVSGILSDPRQIRNRALHSAAQLFRRIATIAGRPIVLLLEDLHWADAESLDFLADVAKVNADVAMLAVGSCRPSLFERRPDWKSARTFQQRLDLRPLGKDTSRLLADELLKKLPAIPAALRELVTGGAEGNPFYMEELVRMLIDQGAIETDGGCESDHWRVNPDKLLSTHVPATLTGVVQARLDGLPAPERRTLQEASVIGHVFWDQALIALDAQATTTLPALVQRELAVRRADAESTIRHAGLREYAFKHAILHQVTYETVLKRTRRDLHGRLARWFAAQTGLRANDFLALTAEHFALSGDNASAAEYHARAAEHAHSRFAHDGVLLHVRKALAALEHDASSGLADSEALSLRWRLFQTREAALDLQGRRAEQRADLDAMTHVAEALNDDRKGAHAAWRRSYLALRTADWATQETNARRGMALAKRCGDDELRLRCQRLLALALAQQGDPHGARTLAEDALVQAQALGSRDVQAACLNALGLIASNHQGDPVAALAFNERTLTLYRDLGNRLNEAIAQTNIGTGWALLGALAQGQQALEAGLKLIRANGDRAMEALTLCTLAEVSWLQADNARALELAQTARAIALAVEAKDTEISALLNVGVAELALGHVAAAVSAFEDCRANAVAIKDPRQHDAVAGLARASHRQGDLEAALALVSTLSRHKQDGGTFEGTLFPRLLELTCWQVLAAAGDERSTEWLDAAYGAVQATAQAISDAQLRDAFLKAIPHNRAIVSAAWERRTEGALPSDRDRELTAPSTS